MKSRPLDQDRSLLPNCLILFVLGSQVCTVSNSAFGESPQLQEQPPIMDQKSTQTSMLQGRVVRHEAGDSPTSTTPSTSGSEQAAKIDGGIKHDSPHFSLRGRKMTSDDYRSLNYGVIGIVAEKGFFSSKQTITEVYPGCPAALAGIEPGDIEVKTDDHVWRMGDNQRSNWNVTDGKAGTPVDVTIRRHRETITFHLIRMNIEDIQNNRVRRMFENLLRRLGPPSRTDR